MYTDSEILDIWGKMKHNNKQFKILCDMCPQYTRNQVRALINGEKINIKNRKRHERYKEHEKQQIINEFNNSANKSNYYEEKGIDRTVIYYWLEKEEFNDNKTT